MVYQLFPLLCGLAAVSFTACASRRSQLAHWLAGFFSALLLTGSWIGQGRELLLLDPTQFATLLVLAAFAVLHNKRWSTVAVVIGGMLTALWTNSLDAAGYPQLPVLIATCLFSVLAFFGALYRKGFVSAEVQDEALIIVIIVALLLSIVPTAIAGWQTATNLHVVDIAQDETYANVGLLILTLAFVTVGGLYSKWKYR